MTLDYLLVYLNFQAMESAGMLVLFQRSIEFLGLRYTTYIGDGDSNSYLSVVNAQPYGPLVSIAKEDCISHVTKRMGNGLREIVKANKGITCIILILYILSCIYVFLGR